MLTGKQYGMPNTVVPRRFDSITVEPARITTLNASPLKLISGQASLFYIPRLLHVERKPGDAWTLNGSLYLQLRWANGLASVAGYVTNAGLMDQANARTAFCQCCGSSAVGYYTSFTASFIEANIGADLELYALTADLTGGSGNIVVSVVFDVFPRSFPFA